VVQVVAGGVVLLVVYVVAARLLRAREITELWSMVRHRGAAREVG
jgi:hypothetical protein